MRAAEAADPTPAVKIRFGGDKTQTRIVLDLKESAQVKLVSDGSADRRLVLELPKLALKSRLDGAGQGLVKAWSIENVIGGSRLNLEFSQAAQIDRRFMLAPADGVAVYRYVIDLKAPGAASAVPAPPPVVTPKPPIKTLQASARTVPPIALRKVVVLDAGHGGKDPGALGSKAREKDITLAATMVLKEKLEKTGRYRVVLTRSTDAYVPLETRVQIARRAEADLFISLHADAAADSATRGATVYTLSDNGSQRVQRNVASNANWFIHVDQRGKDPQVNRILLDLTQRATRNRSAVFAQVLLDNIEGTVPLLRNSHRDAGYMVLLAPDVPAVLLEMGFITSIDDEAMLTDTRVRNRLMDGVAQAIDDFFAGDMQLASR